MARHKATKKDEKKDEPEKDEKKAKNEKKEKIRKTKKDEKCCDFVVFDFVAQPGTTQARSFARACLICALGPNR